MVSKRGLIIIVTCFSVLLIASLVSADFAPDKMFCDQGSRDWLLGGGETLPVDQPGRQDAIDGACADFCPPGEACVEFPAGSGCIACKGECDTRLNEYRSYAECAALCTDVADNMKCELLGDAPCPVSCVPETSTGDPQTDIFVGMNPGVTELVGGINPSSGGDCYSDEKATVIGGQFFCAFSCAASTRGGRPLFEKDDTSCSGACGDDETCEGIGILPERPTDSSGEPSALQPCNICRPKSGSTGTGTAVSTGTDITSRPETCKDIKPTWYDTHAECLGHPCEPDGCMGATSFRTDPPLECFSCRKPKTTETALNGVAWPGHGFVVTGGFVGGTTAVSIPAGIVYHRGDLIVNTGGKTEQQVAKAHRTNVVFTLPYQELAVSIGDLDFSLKYEYITVDCAMYLEMDQPCPTDQDPTVHFAIIGTSLVHQSTDIDDSFTWEFSKDGQNYVLKIDYDVKKTGGDDDHEASVIASLPYTFVSIGGVAALAEYSDPHWVAPSGTQPGILYSGLFAGPDGKIYAESYELGLAYNPSSGQVVQTVTKGGACSPYFQCSDRLTCYMGKCADVVSFGGEISNLQTQKCLGDVRSDGETVTCVEPGSVTKRVLGQVNDIAETARLMDAQLMRTSIIETETFSEWNIWWVGMIPYIGPSAASAMMFLGESAIVAVYRDYITYLTEIIDWLRGYSGDDCKDCPDEEIAPGVFISAGVKVAQRNGYTEFSGYGTVMFSPELEGRDSVSKFKIKPRLLVETNDKIYSSPNTIEVEFTEALGAKKTNIKGDVTIKPKDTNKATVKVTGEVEEKTKDGKTTTKAKAGSKIETDEVEIESDGDIEIGEGDGDGSSFDPDKKELEVDGDKVKVKPKPTEDGKEGENKLDVNVKPEPGSEIEVDAPKPPTEELPTPEGPETPETDGPDEPPKKPPKLTGGFNPEGMEFYLSGYCPPDYFDSFDVRQVTIQTGKGFSLKGTGVKYACGGFSFELGIQNPLGTAIKLIQGKEPTFTFTGQIELKW